MTKLETQRSLMWFIVMVLDVLGFAAIVVIIVWNTWHGGEFGDESGPGATEYAVTMTWFVAVLIPLMALTAAASFVSPVLNKMIDRERAAAETDEAERTIVLDRDVYAALAKMSRFAESKGDTTFGVSLLVGTALDSFIEGAYPEGESK